MDKIFRCEVLPASRGDCLWLEYGPRSDARIVIVDGGLRETASLLRARLYQARHVRGVETLDVELIVVTHIDNDHILGILELLGDPPPWLKVNDVWFNGLPQLEAMFGERANNGSPHDLLGPREGLQLSELLVARDLPWNTHEKWNRGAVVVDDDGSLPELELPGGLQLTVLGPRRDRLRRLWSVFEKLAELENAQELEARSDHRLLGRGDQWPPIWRDIDARDSSVANGSSIMFIAEYESRRILLSGDGYASDLAGALGRVRAQRGLADARFELDAFKLPHHGSARNVSAALLEHVKCARYIVSTDGSQHRHPDHQALLCLLRHSIETPEFVFNYSCATTKTWQQNRDDVPRYRDEPYRCRYPSDPMKGTSVALIT